MKPERDLATYADVRNQVVGDRDDGKGGYECAACAVD